MKDGLFETIVEKVCSTQNLSTALYELQRLLKSHTDVEGVFLGHHAREVRKVYNLAYADSSESHDLNYTQPACEKLHGYLLSDERREMNMLPRLNDFPALAVTLDSHIPTNHSFYEFRVRLDGEHIGMLAFHSARPHLSEATLDLLMKIRVPIALNLARRLDELKIWPRRNFLPGNPHATHIVCDSSVMRPVYSVLNAAAPTNSTILLTGETGVGKDVFAKHVHDLSSKRKKPFVHVNCGSIPESLIESEFFGHRKGAFTGAMEDRAGFFEQADKGTIFLDEIGELPLNMQTRLLQVLQTKTIRRVGDGKQRFLDFRVVAATNCDLEQMCWEGRFRQDLFYRLNCIRVEVPPLRERKEDILSLAENLLGNIALEHGFLAVPAISTADQSLLLSHDWPGNVRELENCLQRSMILSAGRDFRIDLSIGYAGAQQRMAAISDNTALILPEAKQICIPHNMTDGFSLQENTRQHLEKALLAARGRIHGKGGAAELLGINPSTLRSRLKKLGIPFGRKQSDRYQ
ncbi:sigma-54 interaction domain-containing protein [Maridesulfovibrio sp.]|uniref:sigma-54 interaction domain-containing protein n=1 Tax=unclassified Maridesulfovibrio TaxID=2794999 RepID=UPI003B00793E